MAYKTVSTQTVEVMLTSFKNFAKEYDTLLKDKKKKKEAKELKSELDKKSNKIGQQLTKDMQVIKKAAFKHFGQIDAWIGDATRLVKKAQTGLKLFKGTTMLPEYAEATKPELEIEDLVDLARQDSLEFGSSWFAYRSLKVGRAGTQHLNDKDLKSFFKLRLELMGVSKVVLTKIKKIGALKIEAGLIAKEARALKGAQAKDLKGTKKDVANVAKMIADGLKDMKGRQERGIFKLRAMKGNADMTSPTQQQLLVTKTYLKDMISTHKEIKNQMKTQKKAFEAELKSIDQIFRKDPEISQYLRNAGRNIKEAEALVKPLEAAIKAGADSLNQLQKNIG